MEQTFTNEAPSAVELYATDVSNGTIGPAIEAAARMKHPITDYWSAKFAHDVGRYHRAKSWFRKEVIRLFRKHKLGNPVDACRVADEVMRESLITWSADRLIGNGAELAMSHLRGIDSEKHSQLQRYFNEEIKALAL